jgi:hypothetical protein
MGFTDLVGAFCDKHAEGADAEFTSVLKCYKDDWLDLSLKIGEKAMQNPDEAGAAAVDYLMYSGYVTLAYFWARMAVLARQKIAAATGDASFYEAKLMTARFYYDRLLPRTLSHKQALLSGSDNLMAMPEALGSELRQGMLERSNVTLSDEMVEMMRAQRQVESGAQLVRAFDRLLNQAVSTFSRGG